MIVNLIKNENELVEEEDICTAFRKIAPTDGKQAQAEFIYKVENIQNANEYTGL